MADGGFRDALSLLEQVMLTADGPITLLQVQAQLGLVSDELIDTLLLGMVASDVPAILGVLDTIAHSGRDPRAVLESMLYRLADLTRAIYRVDVGGLDDAAQEAGLHETAAKLGPERLLALRAWAAEAFKDIRDISLPRLWLESRLITEARRDPELVPRKAAAETEKRVAQPTKPTPMAAGMSPSGPPVTQAVVSEPKNDAPDPAPIEATGPADPNVAVIHRLWRTMVEGLPANIAHRGRLMESSVIAVEGTRLVVEIPHRMHVDWFSENPKRLGYIVSQLAVAAGKDLQIELRPSKKKGPEPTELSQAVELPAEGQALHDKVVAVFRP
jgi:DNA polymerase-3 subunit gamma/tau